jgi:antitoxin component YwqK of YwqJK toxin-antitoxin module
VELHPNGRARQLCALRDGVAHGKFEAWHESGAAALAGAYAGGKKHGWWRQRDAGGREVASGEYRMGMLVSGTPVGVMALCEELTPQR